MKVKPIGDKILVKRLEAVDVSKGGIILPDSAKEKPQERAIYGEEGRRCHFHLVRGQRG